MQSWYLETQFEWRELNGDEAGSHKYDVDVGVCTAAYLQIQVQRSRRDYEKDGDRRTDNQDTVNRI